MKKVLITVIVIISIFTGHIFCQSDTSIVDLYGQLQVKGNRIVDQNEKPIALHGMSLFWSNFSEGSKYYNSQCVEWLRDDWKCTVVRAAMGVGAYLAQPETEKAKIKTVVDACLDLDIYVIIDWHDHYAEYHQSQAKKFFAEMAEEYGDEPNVIYEIYNEPLQVVWETVIKPYAEAVIDTIRSIDPDNLIIVGTPTWSQRVDAASKNPLEYNNVAYALHFYAGTHGQEIRNNAITALNNGVALFVTEWGTCNSDAQGPIDSVSTEQWCNFLDKNMISSCNWSICDKEETAAALVPGASTSGGWAESDLTKSGTYVRDKIIDWYENPPTSIHNEDLNTNANFELYQNYPNPFNPKTRIQYQIKSEKFVSLKVYNILGQEMTTLVYSNQPAGSYKVEWNANEYSSGVYLYVLKVDDFAESKKMILLK